MHKTDPNLKQNTTRKSDTIKQYILMFASFRQHIATQIVGKEPDPAIQCGSLITGIIICNHENVDWNNEARKVRFPSQQRILW